MARVLIVDDEPTDRVILTKLLERMGHEVVYVASESDRRVARREARELSVQEGFRMIDESDDGIGFAYDGPVPGRGMLVTFTMDGQRNHGSVMWATQMEEGTNRFGILKLQPPGRIEHAPDWW